MKRADDVFFFTLVDFLLQAFFFGLLLYVLNAAQQERELNSKKSLQDAVQKLKVASGFSNITELTDFLTKMVPADQLRGWADFFSRHGGIEKVQKAVASVEKVGGQEKLSQALERLQKFEEGAGKPPCLFTEVAGKKQAIPLATVAGDEATIRFQGSNPKLDEVLALLNTNYKAVERLSLSDFRRTFSPLTQKKPDCRYTLVLIEETRFVDARDAADVAFYTQKRQGSGPARPST